MFEDLGSTLKTQGSIKKKKKKLISKILCQKKSSVLCNRKSLTDKLVKDVFLHWSKIKLNPDAEVNEVNIFYIVLYQISSVLICCVKWGQ